MGLIKILLTVGVVIAVGMVARGILDVISGGRKVSGGGSDSSPPAETLERCPVCGVFRLPGDGNACARAECPFRQKS